jgi:cytochrome c oxidase subunit IV
MVSYEEGLQVVKRGFYLLGFITIAEVVFALLGNGHLIHGFTLPKWVMYPIMVSASLYKAYWIIYNFMHMAYEVKGLAMSVLVPCGLLVWAVVAFFNEGGSWGERRELIRKKNEQTVKPVTKTIGMNETKPLKTVPSVQ